MMFPEAVRYVPRPRRLSWLLVWSVLVLQRCVHAQQVDQLDRPPIPMPLLPIPARSTYISWMSCHVYLICADVPQDSYE